MPPVNKNLIMARAHYRAGLQATSTIARPTLKRRQTIEIIVIGSSTGGPAALQEIVSGLPTDLPVGVLIVQHLPAEFTQSLANRLDARTSLAVREAASGDGLEAGQVLIAPGGRQTMVQRWGGSDRIVVNDQPTDALYKPCLDITLNSVVQIFGSRTMGVILTGMGSNGLDGMKSIRAQGGVIIAQDEATCVVYGMPRVVIEASLADHVAPIEQIVSKIVPYI